MLVVGILAALGCQGPAPVVVSVLPPERVAEVRTAAAPIVDECLDGALSVIDRGAVVHTIAWGPEPSLGRRYVWASVSKPVTAAIVLRLAEAGRLSLDAPVVSLAPAYASLIPADKASPPLTLTHLLSHTGGITRVERRREPKMFMRPPGERYRYSTNGYGIVGDVIAAVTGEPYARAVAALGAAGGMPSLSAGGAWSSPGALVRGDVGDLARFAAGLLDHSLLSEASLTRMATPIGDMSQDDTPRSPGTRSERYGLGLELSGDGTVLAHSGRNEEHRAFLYLRRTDATAFVAVCTARDAAKLLPWWPTAEAVLGAAAGGGTGMAAGG